MKLWAVFSAGLIPAVVFAFRWFLLQTDVLVRYDWKWEGTIFHPSFDIRNRSGSQTYLLANVAYTKGKGKEIVDIDNQSFWGYELRPGSIVFLEVAPVPNITSLRECQNIEVTVRLQNGRQFRGQGPGQLYKGIRRIAFSLRQRIERAALPLAS